MSHFLDSKKAGTGVFAMQDHDRAYANDPDFRVGMIGARIVNQPPLGTKSSLGHLEEDPDFRGDLQMGMFWPPTSRPTGLWRASFPATMTRTGTSAGGRVAVATGGRNAGGCVKVDDRDLGLLPMQGVDGDPDKRFQVLRPPDLEKVPFGTKGIVVQSTDTTEQIEYFFPAGNQLVAVNFAGDPDMGTPVFDLTKDSELDEDRRAPLQSAFRIVKKPLGQNNAIAFQMNEAGCNDTFGGYVVDFPDTGLLAVDGDTNRAVGRMSHVFGGPWRLGGDRDRHFQGKDADGNPVGPVHISTSALIKRSDQEDGPFFFEGPPKDGNDLEKVVPVHLGFDGVVWRWWTTTHVYTPPTPTPPPIRPPVTTPSPIVRFPVEDPRPVQTPTTAVGRFLRYAASLLEVATPALTARPQNYDESQEDTKNTDTPTVAAQRKVDEETPITGAQTAFGAQGTASGDTGYGVPGAHGEGDPWVYTHRPGALEGRYAAGTADGGWIIHPPETDPRDAVENGMRPDGVTLSTTYMIVAPNAWFGCGVPDLSIGAIADGYSWGCDDATADLLFRTHSASGTPSPAIKFTAGQDICWASGTGFFACLEHANTADRTYTFQDADGTVAFLSDIGVGFDCFTDPCGIALL